MYDSSARFNGYSNEFAKPLITPDRLLDEFIIRVLIPMETPDLQRGEQEFRYGEQMREQLEQERPSLRVDPMKLNIDEYRRPGPSSPREPLDRVKFLLSPRSPLT